MLDALKNRAVALAPDLSAVRRHLHANPELSFKETQTAAFVTQQLQEMGLNPYSVAGTGVVALIEGQPGGPVVALRGDMDALPIQELSDIPYKSTKPGVMHACGHDVHTTCLLGAARLLTELRGEFKGTVKLLFQPGEELLPGGASLMIKDGVLENPAPMSCI
jgi:amidohydrolase